MSGTGVLVFLLLCLLAFLIYRLVRRVKKQAEKLKAQEQAIQLVRLEISRTAAAATQTEPPFDPNATEIPITEPPPVYNPSTPQPASISCSQSAANEGGAQR
ncbi:uncharacterized protein TRUGW13939_10168 [Talaromyces rugulosus]|uniref:Uncharacterized protein n=1 Tax=Talaromyces rugulosus TaxID=121627 RepID=A0A7H8R9B0_TALRU|nr:uncharacterized protein TRUGW13939_10168 [Talaromyces rugulosus]QKX63000.1 hypothetical protein TRUGW13939_10168 [Talaromyces rugulosus]